MITSTLRQGLSSWMRGTRARTSDASGFSDLLEYQAMVGDGVAALKLRHGAGFARGPLLGGFWLSGPDLTSASAEQWAAHSRSLNAAFKRLDSGHMIHWELIRRAEHVYEPSYFEDAVDQAIEDERCERASHYVNAVGLFVTQSGGLLDRPVGRKAADLFFGADGLDELAALEARVVRFEQLMVELEHSLRSSIGDVTRMRMREDNDELRQALYLAVNGIMKRCPSPRSPLFMDCQLAYPLEWSEHEMVHAGQHVAVVGLLDMPAYSAPGLMNVLSTLDMELRWSTRFIAMDYQGSRVELNDQHSKWKDKIYPFLSKVFNSPASANRDAIKRTNEVEEAQEILEDHGVRYGHYTSVIVLRGATRAEVDENARVVVRALEERGFEARVETQNRLEALLGSFPGHGSENLRKPVMNTLNLADLLPSTSEWIGSAQSTCKYYPPGSPALAQTRTWGGGVFHLNLHQDGDLGHTLITGQPGSGKSFTLSQMATQFLRYPSSQVIALDQGGSMMALATSRDDGAYYALGLDGSPAICPLAEIDTESERAWAERWIALLAEEQGLTVTASQQQEIKRALRELAESTVDLPERSRHRTLTHLRPHFEDRELKSAVSYYEDGAAGRVLNGESNEFRRARFTVFDIEGLLPMDPKIVGPTMNFIMREAKRRMDGPPTMFIVDEARRLFGQPEIRDYLETTRRANCVMVIATQQLGEVVRSPIADCLLENCKTKIILPIAHAHEGLRHLYRHSLGLTDEQIALLEHAPQKRWYLYFDGRRAQLFTWDAGPVAQAFCGASSRPELNQIMRLMREHGRDWAPAWLEARGEFASAERLREIRLARGIERLRSHHRVDALTYSDSHA